MVKCKNLIGKWGAGQARCEIPTKEAHDFRNPAALLLLVIAQVGRINPQLRDQPPAHFPRLDNKHARVCPV